MILLVFPLQVRFVLSLRERFREQMRCITKGKKVFNFEEIACNSIENSINIFTKMFSKLLIIFMMFQVVGGMQRSVVLHFFFRL